MLMLRHPTLGLSHEKPLPMKPAVIRKGWELFKTTFPRLSCDIDLFRRNQYFERDLWLVPQFCSKTAGAIDVGVNEGIYARWMAKHAARIDAFECNPNLLPKLKRILPQNVHLHPCALSKEAGTARLRFDPTNTGIGTIEQGNLLDNNSGIRGIVETDVPMQRLDDFDIADVSFIKIDVEGHELAVLQGAENIIERDKPALLIEIEERHCAGNLDAVPQWLSQYGYQPHYLHPSEQRLVATDSMRDVAATGVNNFWFLAGEAEGSALAE
jgi:FkbM family methyltransferase